jgi:hypothetical protein
MIKMIRLAKPPPFCTLTEGRPSSLAERRSKCLPSGGRMEAKGSLKADAAGGGGAA